MAAGDKHWWGIYDEEKGWVGDFRSADPLKAIAAYRRKHPGAPRYGLSAGKPKERSDPEDWRPIVGRHEFEQPSWWRNRGVMARRVNLRRNPGPSDLPYGEWIPAHAVKFNSDGSTSLMTERGGLPNITLAGFKSGGKFHPIRWDPRYDPELAGEDTEYDIHPSRDWYRLSGERRPKRRSARRRRR
jgi:hypothetical protein